jgi:hypothetical protein
MGITLARLRAFVKTPKGYSWLNDEPVAVGHAAQGIIGRAAVGATLFVDNPRVSEVHAVVLARGAGAVIQAACGLVYDGAGSLVGRGSPRAVLTRGADFYLVPGEGGVGFRVEEVDLRDDLDLWLGGVRAKRLVQGTQYRVSGGQLIAIDADEEADTTTDVRIYGDEVGWQARGPAGRQKLELGREVDLGGVKVQLRPADATRTTKLSADFEVSGPAEHMVSRFDRQTGEVCASCHDKVVWALFNCAAFQLQGKVAQAGVAAAVWTRDAVIDFLWVACQGGGKGNSDFPNATKAVQALEGCTVTTKYGKCVCLELPPGTSVSTVKLDDRLQAKLAATAQAPQRPTS